MPNIYSITDEEVAELNPSQIGPDHWEFPDGSEVYVSEDRTWIEKRIEGLLQELRRLESIRLARMTPQNQVLVEKAEELCQVMYGVDLKTYWRNYDSHAEHIFKAARYALTGGIPTPPSVSTTGGQGYV